MKSCSLILSASIFAVIAGLTRFSLQHVHTHDQIAAFWLLAAGGEAAILAAGSRPEGARFAIHAGSATIAMLLMRYHLEGFHHLLSHSTISSLRRLPTVSRHFPVAQG